MTIQRTSADQWTVPSQTTVGVMYLVKRYNNALTCDCPGNFHHGHCKHADAVAATLPQRGPSAQDTANIFLAHRRQA